MTDIPRGQGGDGSPQLDLDAIEARQELRRGYLNAYVDGKLAEAVADGDAACALLRRLQQENKERRVDVVEAVQRLMESHNENVALRGRVEELTEALREEWEMNHSEHCGDDWPHPATRTVPCCWPQPPALARVVPEKETP